jgi:hypothetical protein
VARVYPVGKNATDFPKICAEIRRKTIASASRAIGNAMILRII